MPKRRLGRVFLLVPVAVLAAIVALLAADRLRGPQHYVALAEQAIAERGYEDALRWAIKACQAGAPRSACTDLLWRVSELYWPGAEHCWLAMRDQDPCDIRAGLALLEAHYIETCAWEQVAPQDRSSWRSIQDNAAILQRIVQKAGLLDRPVFQWRTGMMQALASHKDPRIGPYLHLIRGHALYQQADFNAPLVAGADLDMAQAELKAAIDGDPCLFDAYLYLYRIKLDRARQLERSGDLEAAKGLRAAAIDLLKKAAKDANSPLPHLNLLQAQLETALQQADHKAIAAGLARLEPGYASLTQAFAYSPLAICRAARFYMLQAYYQGPSKRSLYTDKALQAAKRAVSLEPNDIEYRQLLAEVYHGISTLTTDAGLSEQAISELAGAIRKARSVSWGALPCSIDNARLLRAYDLLARWLTVPIIQRLCRSSGSVQGDELLGLQQVLDQISLTVTPYRHQLTTKWKAILDLVSGKTEEAVKALYALYQEDRINRKDGLADPFVCYVLAKVFEKGPETGKAAELMAEALKAGMAIEYPHAILEYLDLLGRIGAWAYVLSPANPFNLQSCETILGPSDTTNALRIRALAWTGQLAEAQAVLDAFTGPRSGRIVLANIELLEAQIREIRDSRAAEGMRAGGLLDPQAIQVASQDQMVIGLQRQQAVLVCDLVELDPGLAEEPMVVSAARNLADQGRLVEARQVLERFIASRSKEDRPPVGALFTLKLLEEPDPRGVTAWRQDELWQQTLQGLDDQIQKALELGIFYRQTGRLEQAKEQLMAALGMAKQVDWSTRLSAIRRPYANPAAVAADLLTEVAISRLDWQSAQAIADITQASDLDGCGGRYCRARILHAQGQDRQALELMDQAIGSRPAFSAGLLLRASIHTQLGQDRQAMADMEEALRLCPNSPQVAKGYAFTLYWTARRQGLTGQLAPQIRCALEGALRLDPADTRLLGIYAEQIKDAEPLRALQVYQVLLRYEPTVKNALSLADLASSIALRTSTGSRRSGLLEVARLALEHAYAVEPNNPQVLERYASYWLQVGQLEKARQLFERLKDTPMAWRALLSQGQIDQAKALLEQAFQGDPNHPHVLSGLIQIAEMQDDTDALLRYSDRLVSVRQDPMERVDQVARLIR
ncbi:MAG: hypothetical protein QHH07_08790, partial [Sedimentisphaerales bacterium]|nr:hypothetical protein [Sedimentisphaerales bacterium]